MPVIFREEDHTYWNTDTGEQYMSVTTFIGKDEPFDQQEALEKATNSRNGKYKGWDKWDIVKEWDRIRETGTSLHAAIESYIKGTPLESISSEHVEAVYHFSKGTWKGSLASETLLWSHALKLAGTCDIISTKGYTFNLFDIKTCSSLEYKMDKYSKQLYLYAALLDEMMREVDILEYGMFSSQKAEEMQKRRKINPMGIILFQDYVNKPKDKPTFVPILDKQEWVLSLYKKNNP